jgi:ribonuclease-3
MKSLEQRISYKFRNSLLLAEAMTHPSLAYETQKPHFDNQRLEFLGDAVLQLVLTKALYLRFPKFNEGKLTKLRSRLVSRDALVTYSGTIKLGNYLMVGRGEESSGGRDRPSNLADAFEALVGAIYLDSGLEAAGDFILMICAEQIERVAEEPSEQNPKGELQEILQAISNQSPAYRIIAQEGPDHCKDFEAVVEWEHRILGQGSGKSKKEAESEAALNALANRLWPTESKALPAPAPAPLAAAPAKARKKSGGGKKPAVRVSTPASAVPANG